MRLQRFLELVLVGVLVLVGARLVDASFDVLFDAGVCVCVVTGAARCRFIFVCVMVAFQPCFFRPSLLFLWVVFSGLLVLVSFLVLTLFLFGLCSKLAFAVLLWLVFAFFVVAGFSLTFILAWLVVVSERLEVWDMLVVVFLLPPVLFRRFPLFFGVGVGAFAAFFVCGNGFLLYSLFFSVFLCVFGGVSFAFLVSLCLVALFAGRVVLVSSMAFVAAAFGFPMIFGSLSMVLGLYYLFLFAVGALVVYLLFAYMGLLGFALDAFVVAFHTQFSGLFGPFDVFGGGVIELLAIFAVGIMLCVFLSVAVQLLFSVFPQVVPLKNVCALVGTVFRHCGRYGTVFFAALLVSVVFVGVWGGGVFFCDAGLFFRFSTVVLVVGGAMFVMWFGEQFTAGVIGFGVSLIIFVGVFAGLASALAGALVVGLPGVLFAGLVVGILVLSVSIIAFFVFVGCARRLLLLACLRGLVGKRLFEVVASPLPLKFNAGFVVPAFFASSLVLFPGLVAGLFDTGNFGYLARRFVAVVGDCLLLSMVFCAALVVFFSFFFAAVVFVASVGAGVFGRPFVFVVVVRPCAGIVVSVGCVFAGVAVVGVVSFVFVCIFLGFVLACAVVSFFFGVCSFLVVVRVTLVTVGEVVGVLVAQSFGGFVTQFTLRGLHMGG